MQIISVSNRKGGTGKTTVSLNLAAGLAKLGLSTLLVDLDSQGHCAVGLGIKISPKQPCIQHIFLDPELSILSTLCATAQERLFLSPADQLFEHSNGIRDEHRLSKALADPQLRERFDVVILDTPPSLDHLMLNALHAAHWVLIPYIPHHLSLEGIRQLMRVLFKVMSKANAQLRIMGFIPMQVAERTRQHRLINTEVSQQFGALRVLNGIRTDIRLAEAFAAGQPIFQYAPKTRAVLDFSELSLEIARRLDLV